MGRIKTGIPGLDEMIEGGFIENNTILVTGGCGSGKSTFGMQYIYEGAKDGEPGVYVAFEEFPSKIKENMNRYGWDLDKLEKEKKVIIVRIDPKDILHVIKENYGEIVNAITDIGAKRVVIDSISTLELMIRDEFEKRACLLDLIGWLQKHDCTSVMIAETEQDPNLYSRHGIIEFIVDGVLVMYNIRRESARHRALEILKMRGTNHVTKIVPFVISNGIELLPKQKLFGQL